MTVRDGRVEAVEPGEGAERTAWVELRHLNNYRAAAMEPFDLRQLQNNEVDHESQRFEYTVYQLPNDDVATSIDPVDAFE